jgi:hypothetical protein
VAEEQAQFAETLKVIEKSALDDQHELRGHPGIFVTDFLDAAIPLVERLAGD